MKGAEPLLTGAYELDWDDLWENGFKKVKDVHDDDLDRMERYLRVMDRMHEMMMRREQVLMLMHYRQVMIRYNEMVVGQMMHAYLPYHHKATAVSHSHPY
ncbi:MAG: hypothetical protein QJR06_02955 [Alicyclobacillaceae bacterium]|nr:hypothetical protein [Alicyclobacillaceae bacterium]